MRAVDKFWIGFFAFHAKKDIARCPWDHSLGAPGRFAPPPPQARPHVDPPVGLLVSGPRRVEGADGAPLPRRACQSTRGEEEDRGGRRRRTEEGGDGGGRRRRRRQRRETRSLWHHRIGSGAWGRARIRLGSRAAASLDVLRGAWFRWMYCAELGFVFKASPMSARCVFFQALDFFSRRSATH